MRIEHITNKIICGDVSDVLRRLPSDFVDCVVTSPPYWSLRDYGNQTEKIWDEKEGCRHNFEIKEIKNPMDRGGKGQHDSGGIVGKMGDKASSKVEQGFCSKCGAWRGQLGLESTFDLYIKHLCDIFDDVKRVLKKTGTCWVNLGDTYSGGGNTNDRFQKQGRSKSVGEYKFNRKLNQIQEKCLCLIPFRFAIEMANRGWILRNTVIWWKPNCMPSSVKDRFTVDFEYVFFFVKDKKYWFETQYDPLKGSSIDRLKHNFNRNKGDIQSAVKTSGIKKFQERFLKNQVQGRNKRCVWNITTKGFKGAHFAVFPPQLVETPIKAGCPEFVCKKCGKTAQTDYEYLNDDATERLKERAVGGKQQETLKVWLEWKKKNPDKNYLDFYNEFSSKKISKYRDMKWQEGIDNKQTSWGNYSSYLSMPKPEIKRINWKPSCSCNAGFSGGVVLDPFAGSGTTLAVAKDLGRNYIGIDLNPEYIKMAQRRIAKLNEDRKSETKR